MSVLQFAIASIVDANTNYLNGSGSSHDQIRNYQATMLEGRKIRAKSLIAIVDAARRRLAAAVASYRIRAKRGEEVNQLLSLSDRMLRDIGLERGDIVALQADLITFEQLGSKRSASNSATARNIQPTVPVDKDIQKQTAANQDCFAQVNCA